MIDKQLIRPSNKNITTYSMRDYEYDRMVDLINELETRVEVLENERR